MFNFISNLDVDLTKGDLTYDQSVENHSDSLQSFHHDNPRMSINNVVYKPLQLLLGLSNEIQQRTYKLATTR